MGTVIEPPLQPPSRIATYALWLSPFSFLLPVGIAVLVLGHMAQRELRDARGAVAGEDRALAALLIAYLQLGLMLLLTLVFWREYRSAVDPFRQDPYVQQMFRASDQMRTLSNEEAMQESATAGALMYQVIAMQDGFYRKNGAYQCNLPAILSVGVDGMTDAEKIATEQRLQRSPYIFEISDCRFQPTSPTGSGYQLIATPAPPRMPQNSLLFCADQKGEVRFVRGGTSLDCFFRGQPFH